MKKHSWYFGFNGTTFEVKYIQPMDKSICQLIIQSINKSIYKYLTTLWIKFCMVKSKSMHFYCHVYSKLNLNSFPSHVADLFFFTACSKHSEGDTSLILEEQSSIYEADSQWRCLVCPACYKNYKKLSLWFLVLLAAKFPKSKQFFVQYSIYERVYWMRTRNSQNICQIRKPNVFH